MSRFAQYTIANAPESSRPLLARVHKALGFVPNLYATFAESPAVLEGYVALSASLDKGALSPTQRQPDEMAASTQDRCTDCVLHEQALRRRAARPPALRSAPSPALSRPSPIPPPCSRAPSRSPRVSTRAPPPRRSGSSWRSR